MSFISLILLLLILLLLCFDVLFFLTEHNHINFNAMEKVINYFRINNISFSTLTTITMTTLVISLIISGKIT